LQLGLRFIKAMFYETNPWILKASLPSQCSYSPVALSYRRMLSSAGLHGARVAGVSYRPDAGLKDGTREH